LGKVGRPAEQEDHMSSNRAERRRRRTNAQTRSRTRGQCPTAKSYLLSLIRAHWSRKFLRSLSTCHL
jgi:hypothetical protein